MMPVSYNVHAPSVATAVANPRVCGSARLKLGSVAK